MTGGLRQLGTAALVVGLVVFAVSFVSATGAFTTAGLERPANIGLGQDDSAFVGLATADSVSVACSERLVTVTNQFGHDVDVTVTTDEGRDGELFLTDEGSADRSVSFTLAPGASRDVSVTNVRGPIRDDVEFTVHVTSNTVDVTLTRSVPKVPGNEDETEDDGNYGGDGCGAESEADDDDADDEDSGDADDDEDDEDDEDDN